MRTLGRKYTRERGWGERPEVVEVQEVVESDEVIGTVEAHGDHWYYLCAKEHVIRYFQTIEEALTWERHAGGGCGFHQYH